MEWIALSVMFGLYFLASCQDGKQLKFDHSFEILEIARNIDSKLEGLNARITVMEERDQERDFLRNTCTRDQIKALETLITTDECTDASHNCSVLAQCKDTPGGYTCMCHDGYEGDGFVCQDIDECSSSLHDCHCLATCVNTEGGHRCVCPHGFTGNGITCQDVDECQGGPSPCHVDAECTNNFGSFSCSCKQDYHGDGISFCEAYSCNEPARVVEDLGCVVPFKQKKTWHEARISCKYYRGQLLEGISSIRHLDTLKDYFYHSFDGYHMWIGLRNLTWIERRDSINPQSHLWKDGEPTQGGEECGYVCFHDSPRLKDHPCSETKEYYCQWNV